MYLTGPQPATVTLHFNAMHQTGNVTFSYVPFNKVSFIIFAAMI